eukprot:CAMPEP_0114416950 /NCGR_PEP_ID=MMETSP0103-20121206/2703_1 /TAXON_ID=37642 ORGANISM="Paraphysomonas imperforata, Strain PA2" /NCGR_SAMPLE_ID=MMETSP0103 /ASSEMBLY_ACC=CAM_ASM_000201 /LENGTH=216 /DNA_ID=CAMNT_0001585209 /DNA_START=573 /DNA_END=1223 /DNA_ORIENTATION=+
MPNISFKGHLSGILVGLLAVHGILDIILPTHSFNQTVEESTCCSNIYRFSNFVPAVNYGFKITSGAEQEQGLLTQAFHWVKWVLLTAWHFMSTLLYIIGFPVDSCTGTVSRWYASLINLMNTNANRHVFETDTSNSLSPPHQQLDRMEAGGGHNSRSDSRTANSQSASALGGNSGGGGVSNNITPHGQSLEEMEAHRKSARDARLLKFAMNAAPSR